MLSYRHSYHAGNFADVLKHIVLVETLQHLAKKDKAFDYIDTHAGAGLYQLDSQQAQKTAEYTGGIGKLSLAKFPQLADYFDAIDYHNRDSEHHLYPGSPSIAQYFLRDQDRAWLFEKHPNDFKLLQALMSDDKRIRVSNDDGFSGLQALLPPVSRRGLILIDPSYEIKSDYEAVVDALKKAVKKFATGSYALWYPVVERARINQLEKQLINSGIRRIQLFELGIQADTDERGMTASGMIVINPPWSLLSKMAQLLPELASTLGENQQGHYRCQVLVDE